MCYNLIVFVTEDREELLALPPLPACPLPRRPPQTKGCHLAHSARSLSLSVGPRANPPLPPLSTRCAQLDTPVSAQPLPFQPLAHTFRHTRGWGTLLPPPDSRSNSISFRITCFAGHYPLTLIESHLYKKQGRGLLATWHSPISRLKASLAKPIENKRLYLPLE
jgi:hypothetical protein